jgi:sphinganine-1-phosphate aldolase
MPRVISLPRKGKAPAALRRELQELQSADWQHREGRLPLHGYFASEAVTAIAEEAFSRFAHTNALAPAAFPSCSKMEADVVSMSLGLLAGGAESEGNITSGGTESIILAVKSARDRLRMHGKTAGLNIVVPSSAHPAFDKAAQLLGLEARRVKVGADWRCDVGAMEDAIDGATALIAASAPSLPYGLIDPVAAISELALRRQVWLHVDACIGGLLAPFVRMNGRPVPDFDFRLAGVRSISADLHKFGYSSKGASLVLYRNRADHHHQAMRFNSWPKGEYHTPTLAGTRSGGPIASAWAVMNFLGLEGYCELAERLMQLRDRYLAGVRGVAPLSVLGEPELSVLTFTSREVDLFAVADAMRGRGWYMSLVAEPVGIQQTVNLVHAPVADAYFSDLAQAVSASGRGTSEAARPPARQVVTY